MTGVGGAVVIVTPPARGRQPSPSDTARLIHNDHRTTHLRSPVRSLPPGGQARIDESGVSRTATEDTANATDCSSRWGAPEVPFGVPAGAPFGASTGWRSEI